MSRKRRGKKKPEPRRKDAMSQRVAAKDRVRRAGNWSGDVERDMLTMGWVSEATKRKLDLRSRRHAREGSRDR